MNRLFFIFIAVMAASPFVWKHLNKETTKVSQHNAAVKKNNEAIARRYLRLKGFANELEQYAKENEYNTHYCFLVDMSITCGSKRFFVYDIKRDTILQSGLVTHGYGNSNGQNITFSNVPGSNSTSLGKYKIGNPYNGKFGLAYKLYGLDKTNSNAFNRFVVLHSHDCVPDSETAPDYICMSQGCPTVAPSFLRTLTQYLDDAGKPVLLWIFK